MPARPRIDRPVKLLLSLPESIRARLDLHLVSSLEGRVPKGAYQEFFIARIREFFDWERCDTGNGVVIGPKETIEELKRRLA